MGGSMNYEQLVSYLNDRFAPCGLNADFWCETWRIKPNVYIIDYLEDNRFAITTRDLNDEESKEQLLIETEDYDLIIKMIDTILEQ
jgi:hypothetical protein